MTEYEAPAQDAGKKFDARAMGQHVPYTLPEQEMRDEIAAHAWPFYVYALCTPSGAAFYIGKGKGVRLFDHALEAAAGGTSEKCRVIRLLGPRLRYGLVASCADESFAVGIEAFHINDNYAALTNIKPGTLSAIYGMLDPQDRDALTLRDTLSTLFEAQVATLRAARRLVAKHPHLRGVLFPQAEACH